MFSKYIV